MGGAVEPSIGEGAAPPERRRIYAASIQDDRLWQGEILCDVTQTSLSLESLRLPIRNEQDAGAAPKVTVEYVDHPRVIVLAQDCDLLQDYKARKFDRAVLFDVLLCDIHDAEDLHQRLRGTESTNSREWREIRENRVERFQFLSSVQTDSDLAGIGLPSLAIDFRRHFSIRTDELYEKLRLGIAKRRSRLQTPYAEHLAHRFHCYQSRIALPLDHPIS